MRNLIVRRLASASERNLTFGFPVMGQSLRFLARASMTGIPFIPECSLTPDCVTRYSTASNGGFCVPSRIKSGQRGRRVAPACLGQSQQVAPLMNVAGRASVQNNDRTRSQASKNTVANRAASDANVAITGEQSRPVHENPAGSKASRLVTSPRSICVTMAATVRHDGVTSKGVSLVASEPKASEAPNSVRKKRQFKATVIPPWGYCLQPTRTEETISQIQSSWK